MKWIDKKVAGRLFKPVDAEHVGLANCKASTFMGFFEAVAAKLILYEKETNPIGKEEILSADKNADDEEFMKQTADHNEPDPESPKRVRMDSISKDEDGPGIQGSTSAGRRNSSPNKVKKFKKMTVDVRTTYTRN